MTDRIVFENVSKFYGEVLGVNRVSLNLPPGITTLVGPNGSGKTTLMNLMTGLVQRGFSNPVRQMWTIYW
jgi:ABC-2 type transport system ATP-binding protein